MGPNGKVNNMIKPFEAAKYDLIAISDSSIKGRSNHACSKSCRGVLKMIMQSSNSVVVEVNKCCIYSTVNHPGG